MLLSFFLVFVVAPVVELGVFLEVASIIGVWPAVLLQLAVSGLGVVIVKRAGSTALRRARAAWGRGEVPAAEVGDGLLRMAAGVLCIVPGFVTGGLGLLLLVPPVRAFVRRRVVRRWMEGRRIPAFARSRSVVDVEWIGDVTPGRGSTVDPIELGPSPDRSQS